MNQTLSNSIKLARVPLMVLIVFIHADILEVTFDGHNWGDLNNYDLYVRVFKAISLILADIAVPVFFLLSGFLFFRVPNAFGVQEYKLKISKRVRTLLIPYLFWNTFTILLFLLAQSLVPSMMSGVSKLITDYSIKDFFLAFWDMSLVNPGEMNVPVAHQLWFLRDLIVVSVISPLLFFFVKYTKIYGLLLMGLLWFAGIPIPLIGSLQICLFFWSVGAYFALNSVNFGELFKHSLSIVIPLYLICVLIEMYIDIPQFSAWGGVFT